MKDLFSKQSDLYAQYRPGYPDSVYAFILNHVAGREAALDCATGNGQVASALSPHFKMVHAIDISEGQLSHAIHKQNIQYSRQPAEDTSFPGGMFDLLTVGQAIHWFNFDRFYAEVNRVVRPGGLLAVLGYSYPVVNPEVDKLLESFNADILAGYWEPERKYIDAGYGSIPFPFEEIETPALESTYGWSADHFIGFLRSWSPVQKYIKTKGTDPVVLIEEGVRESWPVGQAVTVRFPILLRVGRINPA
jgi:SAM-dependent methyltransferase